MISFLTRIIAPNNNPSLGSSWPKKDSPYSSMGSHLKSPSFVNGISPNNNPSLDILSGHLIPRQHLQPCWSHLRSPSPKSPVAAKPRRLKKPNEPWVSEILFGFLNELCHSGVRYKCYHLWPCSYFCGPLEQPVTNGTFQIQSVKLLIHAYVVARGHGTGSVRATGQQCSKSLLGKAIIHQNITLCLNIILQSSPPMGVLGNIGICRFWYWAIQILFVVWFGNHCFDSPINLNGTLRPGQLRPGIPTAESFSRRLQGRAGHEL